MSLINQMLKELDARRADASGASPFGQQIRAVPDQSRIHPAWWIALALGCTLVAVVAWIWLRPPVSESEASRAKLPLRLETGLDIASIDTMQSQSAGAPIESLERQAPSAVVTPEPVATAAAASAAAEPVTNSDVDLMLPGSPGAKSTERVPQAAATTAPVPKTVVPVAVQLQPQTPEKGLTPRSTPALGAAPAPAQAQVSVSPPLTTETATPTVTKQVRELTTLQLAENEFRKATLAIQQARQGEAIVALEQTLQLDARHVAARQALIGLMLDTGQMDEAMRLARAGLELDQRQAGLAMILARLQVEKGALRPAIETLERTRSYAVERPDYLAFLAALLQRDDRHRQAAEAYILALQKSPQNGVWWMGLGISFQADHRNAEAHEAFSRAKASNSLSPELTAFVDTRLAQTRR